MQRFWTKLDGYILRKFLGTFVYSIALIIVIVIIFDISEKVEDFLKADCTVWQIISEYYLNFVPFFVNLFSPLFTFIAVIFFTSRLAARTEIVAMLSAGISFRRLLRPYLVGATLISITSLILNNYLIPIANKTRLDFEAKYILNKYVYTERDIHRQVAPGVFVYMEHYNNDDNIGTRFTLEKFESKKDGSMELTYKLTAKDIIWDSIRSKWTIRDYVIRRLLPLRDSLQSGKRLDTTFNLSPKDFGRAQMVMETMTAGELDKYIADEKMKGSDNVQLYEIEKHKRLAFPFATFILTLIGVAMSSRKVRGGIGIHIGLGILLSFTFILFMQVFTSFAASGVMPPSVAVWIPNVLFGIICVFLLRRAPK